MDSSSFPWISNQYKGRFVHQWPNRLVIYDGADESQATSDSEEEEQNHCVVSTIGPEPVPYVVLVQGPPNVGKSLLIKSLVKVFTKRYLNNIRGPITVVSGKHRRLQFVECPNDVYGMIDAAKYADLVLICIDASYGFEMETFEFFNLLQVHGFPNVIGVFSHFDKIKVKGNLIESKKRLSRQFWNEICGGAELFYLSFLDNGMYADHQIHKLAKLISVMKFNPLSWQTAHPYVLVDHFEDVTSPERMHIDKKCDRNIVMYGYLRGSNLKRGTKVHIAGVGDFPLYGITSLADPCSLPSAARKKGVSDKESLFYAPMYGLEDLLYDNDKLNDLDEVTRSEIEGFRAGTYIKLEVRDVPFKMTKNIDPYCPVLVGGISIEEEIVGYMQARFKQHSWHMKSLKTGDPIIVSVGWRRYQTKPIYAQEAGGNRLHRIHYTPRREDCLAMFWGPLAPLDTGVAAVHNVAGNKAVFRISAMGVILDFTQAAEIIAKIAKKRKQVGTPLKIFKKTALIEDMLTSDLEIDWFGGAAIQTARRVRENVKKAAQKKLVSKLVRKGDQPREGIASCSFQHEIFRSDNISMHVGEQVGELKNSSDCVGQGMDTVVELKNSLEKDGPARRQLEIEERRGVVFCELRPNFGTRLTSKEFQPKRRPKEREELSKKEKHEKEKREKYIEKLNVVKRNGVPELGLVWYC
ncbi:hypothetical protein MKW94_009594 [Papaver nudicaule]|uniref:Bms1-type G domain-containing protein n=1 Tax=Papaver nudicaule TaxID=74823 RepID=A0AA41VVJ7_PAPNU|nr:hypothetical protein [Papaver nudicaule]